MASKFSKRGKNPGAIDAWLDSLGYYRKNVAYDETCLFRAVSEQLFYSQLYHEKVRRECIMYGKKHCREFKSYFPKKRDLRDRLQKLELHMQICGDVEIQLVCNTYRVDISIFNGNEHTIQDLRYSSINKIEKNILLCKMNEDHYDSVYGKQFIADAGFCQSIVYNLLYENVFQISNVSTIVNSMLHEKQPVYSVYQSELNTSIKEEYFSDEDQSCDDKVISNTLSNNSLIAPFPFKVAKALDPNIYRNIEYDTWLEIRRSMRLGDWYYGDEKLILGTRCLVEVNGVSSPCYIQEILKENKCIVYVTSLAERWTVDYSDLRPENNAKPWPLPYRFVRKTPLILPNELVPVENEHMSLRKRREKNHINNSNNSTDDNIEEETEIKGCNLEKAAESNLTEKDLSINISTASYTLENENWNHLNNSSQVERLSLNWPQSPIICNSDPNTSDKTIPVCQETTRTEQYFYNYDQDVAYNMPMWIPHSSYVMPSESNASFSEDQSSPIIESEHNSQNYVYYQIDNSYGSNILSPPISTPSLSLNPFNPPINDRIICSTPVPPLSPHCDSYSFVYPLPPQNPPMFYQYPSHPYPTVTPRPPELLAPLRPVLPMYGNPNELQYSPPAYVYSPQTPPVAWFPSSAQGFIFPPPATP
ncbi:hypothetical protein FQA39_LY00711 [Lamprigera yunnana]|nr:hypothetical protein FQA39_LY00711 [Lamprigera yunnana]